LQAGPTRTKALRGRDADMVPKAERVVFRRADRRMMVAQYTVVGDVFRAEKHRPWSEGRFVARPRTGPTRSFNLHPDGDRFALANEIQAEPKRDKLVFIFNFFDELRRVAIQK
jgi:hypothetical protein